MAVNIDIKDDSEQSTEPTSAAPTSTVEPAAPAPPSTIITPDAAAPAPAVETPAETPAPAPPAAEEQPTEPAPEAVAPSAEPLPPADSAPETPVSDATPPETPAVVTSAPNGGTPKSRKGLWLSLVALLIIALAAAGYWYWHNHNTTKPIATVQKSTTPKKTTPTTQGPVLDPNKNYGNKYANGVLPVGDGKYTTTAAKTGYVYACSQYSTSLASGQGGASTRGPWFVNNNTQYDSAKKLHVLGSVVWKANFTNTVSGSTRTIATNDLPTHTTGIFPIQSSDPAYAYDKNPNSIKTQTLTYALTANPTYSATPNCMGGESGIMLTGIALFNAFDAGGRDAGAWEVQDSCSGHPQSDGIYHYHTLSSCVKDISVHTVLGYALDGFPITGPNVGTNNILTTSDLDECHGITSSYTVDGKNVTGYHYVMTQDFPYSVSCFRGTAIQPPDLIGKQPSHP